MFIASLPAALPHTCLSFFSAARNFFSNLSTLSDSPCDAPDAATNGFGGAAAATTPAAPEAPFSAASFFFLASRFARFFTLFLL